MNSSSTQKSQGRGGSSSQKRINQLLYIKSTRDLEKDDINWLTYFGFIKTLFNPENQNSSNSQSNQVNRVQVKEEIIIVNLDQKDIKLEEKIRDVKADKQIMKTDINYDQEVSLIPNQIIQQIQIAQSNGAEIQSILENYSGIQNIPILTEIDKISEISPKDKISFKLKSNQIYNQQWQKLAFKMKMMKQNKRTQMMKAVKAQNHRMRILFKCPLQINKLQQLFSKNLQPILMNKQENHSSYLNLRIERKIHNFLNLLTYQSIEETQTETDQKLEENQQETQKKFENQIIRKRDLQYLLKQQQKQDKVGRNNYSRHAKFDFSINASEDDMIYD
ncbi:UNKNOWN [Stylonychia lemnae]|uniref:Uncharacterized protein n=1 Tax=Stylonychia lemnae TaxID=5949 RepID=A0A078AHF1_STYLE|nr:UNKNOWN [Stylonychia lemnae]|eukprot:CDW81679.1 UNKNOWN [Stylonychia lemnae]